MGSFSFGLIPVIPTFIPQAHAIAYPCLTPSADASTPTPPTMHKRLFIATGQQGSIALKLAFPHQ
jgi:hypothetical protein